MFHSLIYSIMDTIMKIVILTLMFELSSQSSILRGDGKQTKTQRNDKTSKEGVRWLTDSIVYDDYQADVPIGMTSQEVCPPVHQLPVDGVCPESSCTSDIDCSDKLRCCFTGCTFTCVPEVRPAAVVDWIKEPRRSRSGISWLIGGSIKRPGIGERCSTTPVEKDEDPLLCPYGYYCHVTDHGSPKKGIPNSGLCVKRAESDLTPVEEGKDVRSELSVRKHCTMDRLVLLNGASIRRGSRKCRCRKGHLICSSNESNPNTDVEVEIRSKNKTKSSNRHQKSNNKQATR